MRLAHPITNGAGSCKTLEEVQILARSDLSAIMVGSATARETEGNANNTFYYEAGLGSINSVGLKSPGIEYYEQNLPQMIQIAHDAGKLLFFNGAAENPDDFAQLARLAQKAKVDMLEANLGCPNRRLTEVGVPDRIICFDPKATTASLRAIRRWYSGCLAAKVSPYSDWVELIAASRRLRDYVDVVTVCNTFPAAFMFRARTNRPAVVPQFKGLAGYAGAGMRPIALGQVIQWHQALEDYPNIAIIGCGGISTGRHVQEFLWCGATTVQIVTELVKTGKLDPAPIGRLLWMYKKESGKWNGTKKNNDV